MNMNFDMVKRVPVFIPCGHHTHAVQDSLSTAQVCVSLSDTMDFHGITMDSFDPVEVPIHGYFPCVMFNNMNFAISLFCISSRISSCYFFTKALGSKYPIS